jgi:thioredoxin reductase
MKKTEISIIGAGPAGIAASIQLKRFGYEPVLIEKDKIGGLLWNANLIENYPGFPGGISGPDLISLMSKQLSHFKIEVQYLNIDHLESEGDRYILTTNANKFTADFVVIASGTKPKPIEIRISESVRRSIHQDISNILSISGKHIVIIGNGDAAFDQAINLSKRNQVSILNRGNKIKSLELLVDRALAIKSISYLSNAEVESIDLQYSNPKDDQRILLINYKTENKLQYSLECDEVVFAIGREPQLDFVGQLTGKDNCIYVGDVNNGMFRQATIAIGDGIKAAMKIHNLIRTRF